MLIVKTFANPSRRVVEGESVQSLAYWDYGFESRLGHGCLSLVNAVCCLVEVSATGRVVWRSPTKFSVSECDLEASTMRKFRPIRDVEP